MGYRFIQLSPEDISLLEKTSKTCIRAHIRRKCDAILLSHRGYDIKNISGFYKVRTHTIRDWMNSWIAKGIDGFSISTGRGRKAEIDPNNTDLVDALTKAINRNPQYLDMVCTELNKSNDLNLTKNKVIRFLKKLGYSYRRLRKCIGQHSAKKCQDLVLNKELVEKLCQILYLEKQGLFKVYYGDQSEFSLTPCLPYGWQPKGEYVRICSQKSKRLNVFGLLAKDNDLQVYSTNSTISSDLMIAFLDDFAQQIKQKTVVVLDSAPINHSNEFQEQITIW